MPRSISAAAFAFGTGGAVQRTFGYGPDAVAAWAATLPQPAGCLYESGPTGSDLKGRLVALGLPCHAGAVSKMARPSGDRAKTDRRDAHLLSRLLAVGELVDPCGRLVPGEHVAQARKCEERRGRLDPAIAERSGAGGLAGAASRHRAMRGVSTVPLSTKRLQLNHSPARPGRRRAGGGHRKRALRRF